MRALQQELARDRIVSKARIDRYGRACGGKPLARGALYLMLQNPIYRGEIVHKDTELSGRAHGDRRSGAVGRGAADPGSQPG